MLLRWFYALDHEVQRSIGLFVEAKRLTAALNEATKARVIDLEVFPNY